MITVSVCMIVKNEEKLLGRCLNCLKEIADEIIIVDTGSTDNTKKVAAEYTDRIYDFSWTGSFSDARNFSFSKATKDYIYAADADEVLDDENQKQFLLLKQAMLPEIEIVQMWYKNCGEEKTTENFSKEYRPKLYKRVRNFVWEDPIHEMVRLTPVVFDSNIVIEHRPEGIHASRDLEIFHRVTQQGEKLSQRLKHLYARELIMAGTLEHLQQAASFFEKNQKDQTEDILQMKEAGIVLAREARKSGKIDILLKNALKDMLTEPTSEMCIEIGNYYEERGDYEEAIIWYYNAAFEAECIIDRRAGQEIPLERMAFCYERMAECLPEKCVDEASVYRENAIFYRQMSENSKT